MGVVPSGVPEVNLSYGLIDKIMGGETLNGIPVYLNEPKMALDFLVEKLGLTVYRQRVSKNVLDIVVCDGCGNFYEIFPMTQESVNRRSDVKLVIGTNDCLHEFYNMVPKGIVTLNRPHYLQRGLAFDILDPWGNQYTFLEIRDYTGR